MNQGYGHVGRPTNEEVKSKKRKRIIKVIVPVILILVIVGLLTSKTGLKGIMGNAVYDEDENTEYYCENSEYTLEEDKCIKYVTVESKLLGNINDDSIIDDKDLELLRQIKDEEIEYTSIQYNAADIDQNGEVEDEDYRLLASNLAGTVAAPVYADNTLIGATRVCPDEENLSYELDDTVCKAIVDEVDASEREIEGEQSEEALEENQDENEEEIKVDVDTSTSAQKYNIKLDAQGGKASKTSMIVTEGSIYGSLPNPTRTGYTFKGWYTEEEGKGQRINNSTKVTVTEDITLYAYWKAKTYKISLNAQGGTLSKSSKKVVYYEDIGKLPKPSKKGYTFKGWYTKKNGKGTEIDSYDWYKYTKNITLYAYYEPKEYSIELNYYFDGNTSTDYYSEGCLIQNAYNNSFIYIKYNQKVKLPKKFYRKCGYTFKGWYTQKKGKGDKLTSSSKYKYTKNIKLYAYFKPKTYILKFDPKGGKASFKSKKVTVSKKIGKLPKVSKQGYDFSGWHTKKDSSGYSHWISRSSEYLNKYGTTVYAQWHPIDVSINIDAYILKPSIKSLYWSYKPFKNFESSIGDLSKISVPKGYTLKGWYTKRNGKGHRVYSKEKVADIYKRASKDFTIERNSTDGSKRITGYDLNIYAYIVANKYKVYLKSNGGMESNKYKTVDTFSIIYGGKYPDLKYLDGKQGCRFEGWYTKKGRGGKRISYRDTFKYTKNITLYAGWQC